ncbi:MAG: hypothetical protein WAX14_11180 [Rhodococcus sp. (in: high G+C Gram-positive bacteria)]
MTDTSTEVQNLRTILAILDDFFAGGADDIELLDGLRDQIRGKLARSGQ